MVVMLREQTLECLAVKPYYGSDKIFVVLAAWNKATPFRVYNYDTMTKQQSGSGVYCFSWEEALNVFNKTGNN